MRLLEREWNTPGRTGSGGPLRNLTLTPPCRGDVHQPRVCFVRVKLFTHLVPWTEPGFLGLGLEADVGSYSLAERP